MSIVRGVIMAGGKGTRFWPESTSRKPKQYLSLTGDHSLLYQTLERLDGLVEKNQRYIVTTKDQKDLAIDSSLGKIEKENIILEPFGRNTAPCLFLTFLTLLKSGASEKDIVAVFPADHVILNQKGFQSTVKKAVDLACEESMIVTIGIPPTFPHTGYGYIQKAQALSNGYRVAAFKEKPSKEVAMDYVKSGEYAWNAGMFLASLEVFLNEIKICSPELYKYKDELLEAIGNAEKVQSIYKKLPEDSIDFAVMEKTKKIAVVDAEFDWNDLGSWDALESVLEKTQNNTLQNNNNGHSFIESKGNIVFAPNQFVSCIGLEDVIIVSNEDVLLALPKNRAQDIKTLITELKSKNSSLL